MINKILIANRGEIACRIIKTAQRLGIKTVAVYSDADRKALHVQMADEELYIGPAEATHSYLVIDKIIEAVKASQSDAVHPGYGFLSENASFVQRLEHEKIVFIGPPARAIELMGDKLKSKKIAANAGVSTVPGHLGIVESTDAALGIAREIGFPVMIKASAGGGGKGMRVANNENEVIEGFKSSQNEAANSFGDNRLIIEKFIESPRHIEIQVLADSLGNCIYLNERECSIQRRNQKVIEEAPSPFLDSQTRQSMGEQAVRLAKAVDYQSAGTVEFIVDKDKNFYFLEMNTRLQVEHPVTELTTGIDLVEQMIRVATNNPLELSQDQVPLNGWAIESRVYAEDPRRNFLPSTGRLSRYRPPQEMTTSEIVIRNDTGVYEGDEISVYYDPMIAKLCSWASDRKSAILAMQEALDCFEIEGIAHNLAFLSTVYDHPRFIEGNITTGFIEEEFKSGFSGAVLPPTTLQMLASCTAYIFHMQELRKSAISGQMTAPYYPIERNLAILIDNETYSLKLSTVGDKIKTIFKDDGLTHFIESHWRPNQHYGTFQVERSKIHLKISYIPYGYQLNYRGSDLTVLVKTSKQINLSAYMKEIIPPDTTKILQCPMPGLLTDIFVSIGDTVEEGQPLCTIEAMKMENVLKAPKGARISAIKVAPGDTLLVDQTIIEFET